MNEEISSLKENQTWQLVEPPLDKRVLSNKWIFKVKRDSLGSINRFKARLVVRGCLQRKGRDFSETFAPVVRFETIRTILSIAVGKSWNLKQFDVKTAFLYGEIDTEVYVQQPEGFQDGTNRVCKLIKSLYGLKQAPRCWNYRFVSFIKTLKFVVSYSDTSLFIYSENEVIVLLALYVDDGLIVSNSKEKLDEVLMSLKREFQIVISDLNYYLGIQIDILNDNSIFIHQTTYIRHVLEKFGMSECKTVKTPIETISNLKNYDSVEKSNLNYREVVGSLMYLAQVTRPDICFPVSFVSRYLDNPTAVHFTMVKRILRYLKGTADMGLLYGDGGSQKLDCYSDSDFGNDVLSRRSMSGVLLKLGNNPVIWSSRRQNVVALSTTEAEYIAASEAVKEMIWLRRMVNEIFKKTIRPVLFVDNQSSIKLIKNPEFHRKTKHIDVKYHFVREKYDEKIFEIVYVPTDEQQADVFTKALTNTLFAKAQRDLNLRVSVIGRKQI